jgi:16S rRNA (cytosine1402-N4)-methyltransferase
MSTSPPLRGRWDTNYHAPVLASEILRLMEGRERVLDGTLGGAGHSLALLESGVREVVGVDRDPDAIAEAEARLAAFREAGRFRAVRANYAEIDQVPELDGWRFDGIVLDLGISSHQIDVAERGFSFREGAPLDMRMAGAGGENAADVLNDSDERELMRIFREYADEPRAGRLAREIVRRRSNRPFETSDDFVGAIRGALGPRSGPGDFARLFQGLRIAVNDELSGLESALPVLRDRLEPGGVLAVISYHSGEDRIVKRALREWSADCICPPRQPVCTCRGRPLGETLLRRPVSPAQEEKARNPRSRSARLRAWRAA